MKKTLKSTSYVLRFTILISLGTSISGIEGLKLPDPCINIDNKNNSVVCRYGYFIR